MKTIIPFVFFVCFIAFIARSENEPNNVPDSANALTLNIAGNGNIPSPDNQDWWKITTITDGVLNITTTNIPSGQFWVRLFDADKTTELSSSLKYNDGSGGTINYSLMPNTYYIKIERYDGTPNYSVTATLTAAPFPNDNENNDIAAHAAIISVNDSLTGHLGYHTIGRTDNVDWWKITPGADVNVTISTTNENTMQFWVRLYDSDTSTELYSSLKYYDHGGGTIPYPLGINTYFIKIEKYSGYGSYSIKTPVAVAPFPDDAENNDLPVNAARINPNDSLTGHLGYRSNRRTDAADWWKITTTTDGRLTINTTNESTMQFWVRLYDTDTVTELSSSLKYFDHTGGTITYSLMPNTYFIKIERYQAYGSYTLKTPFIPAAMPNDAEVNDQPVHAAVISPNDSLTGHLGYFTNHRIDYSDWWRITTTTDGKLTINTTNDNTMQFRVRLYDADTISELASSFKYFDHTGGTVTYNLMPNTYFVKIEYYEGYGSYSISTPFVPGAYPNDMEINDLPHNACTINPDDSLTGHLGYYTNHRTDYTDWWKLTTTLAGKLSINATNERTVQFAARLYAPDTTSELGYAFRYFDGSGGIINCNTLLQPNTYFIKIDQPYNAGSYSLKTTFRPAPIARFGVTGYINTFSFTDSSLYAGTYLWDFSDGTNSTQVNPRHVYQQPGVYNVCLITNSPVGSDTVCHYISIRGIKDVYINRAGNTGDATIFVYGGGFTPNTTFRLTRSGYSDITGDSVTSPGIGCLRTKFDLRNKSTGSWNVVVEIPGDTIMTLAGGFTIETGVAADPWVDIVGRDKIIFNRKQSYNITYGNNSNVDASGVPLWIVVSREPGISVTFEGVEFDLPKVAIDSGWIAIKDSVPLYFDVDSLFGEAFSARIYGFYIPIIPAGQTGSVRMNITSNQNVKVMAWVNPPYFQSPLSSDYKTCVALAAAKMLASGIGLASPIGGCVHSVMTNYIYDPWAYKQPPAQGPTTWGSALWNLTTTALSCIGAFTPLGVAMNFAVTLTSIAADFQSNWDAATACKNAYNQKSKKDKSIRAVNSFDPNEMTGPAGYAPEKYSLRNGLYPYTISFENLPSASAPAQDVFVTDTLDLNVFDIRNFSFGTITFGDTVFVPLSGQKEFTNDIDLRPGKNTIVRIDARLDTTGGVITWHFSSLNPTDMSLTDNPDDGFLPPDINSPEGEGSVTFSAGLKSSLVHGNQIKNKAIIVFDVNAPIVTNQWLNTLDMTKPRSDISQLSATISDTLIQLNWSGTDAGSGVRNYTIYVSENDSDYYAWNTYTPATSGAFHGTSGSRYRFYSIAYDSLGLTEDTPANPDATTQIVFSINENDNNLNALNIYPNPANDKAEITFRLSRTEKVVLKVSDISGREVVSLINESVPAGMHRFNLITDKLRAGLYFINLLTENSALAKKFSIIR